MTYRDPPDWIDATIPADAPGLGIAPIVSGTEPSSPLVGQRWKDTSGDLDVMKIWAGSFWAYVLSDENLDVMSEDIRHIYNLLTTMSLGDLDDVNTTGATTGQVLKKSSGDWVPDTDLEGGGGSGANPWAYIDYTEQGAPATPAANTLRAYSFDDNGITLPRYKDAAGVTHDPLTERIAIVQNTSGGTISKGQVVRYTGNRTVSLADQSSLATMPAVGVVLDTTIANSGWGKILVSGIMSGINTTGTTVGAPLFVGTTGTLTATAPSSPNYRQSVGVVQVVGASGQVAVNVSPYFQAVAAAIASDQVFSFGGDLTVRDSGRWSIFTSQTILRVRGLVTDAPTGSGVSFELRKNGSLISGSQLTITAGASSVAAASLNHALSDTDYVTAHVTAIDSGNTAKNLTVNIERRIP